MYNFFYLTMLIGYSGVTFLSADIKGKAIGLLLLIVNGLIFYKG